MPWSRRLTDASLAARTKDESGRYWTKAALGRYPLRRGVQLGSLPLRAQEKVHVHGSGVWGS